MKMVIDALKKGIPYLRACHASEKPAENGRFESRILRGPYLRVKMLQIA